MTKLNSLFLAIALTLPIATASAAGSSAMGSSPAARSFSGTLSAQQRGAAAAQFVRQWGAYVEGVYGLDVGTWAQRMVPQFSRGDATNIQRALARTTYEGAMAEFNGVGHKLTDDQVVTQLARSTSGSLEPSLIGATTNDLVYTPITPCRIADTRNTLAGAIAANTSRNFGAWGYSSFSSFGGSSTNCGTQSEHPSAVVVNVTAVAPAAAGYGTAYAGDLASPPLVATVNYKAGDVMNNLAVVNINPGTSPDFKIYTYAQAHYTVDIVGFYDNPHATPIDCVDVVGVTASIAANSTGFANAATCAASYERVSIQCQSSAWDSNLVSINPASCAYRTGASAATANAISHCCRIPGR